MTLGLNPISPIGSGSSSTPTNPTNETSENENNTTTATNNSTTAEQSSGAGQASEAKASQTVQPVSTDVAVTFTAKSDILASPQTTELSESLARQFAVRARAESIVAALVDAISAPIQSSEIAAVEAAEAELKAGEAQQNAVLQQGDSFEEGLSSVRADS